MSREEVMASVRGLAMLGACEIVMKSEEDCAAIIRAYEGTARMSETIDVERLAFLPSGVRFNVDGVNFRVAETVNA